MTTLHRVAERPAARILASLFILSGILAAVSGLGVERASAADNGHWSVFPTTARGHTVVRPYFQPLLSPGVPVHDSVTLTNKTSRKQNFNIYGTDAYNSPSGIFLLRLHGQAIRDIGTWIHLPVDSVTVRAHRALRVPFTILPPPNATPGDHAGGIIVEPTRTSVSNNGALQVHQIDAVAVRMYARVRGPLSPSLAVTSLHVGEQSGGEALLGARSSANVTYTVTNTGNLNLTPKAVLSVSPVLGSAQHRTTLIPQLLPGGSATITQQFTKIAPSVVVRSHVVVTAPRAAAEASTTTLKLPWLLLALIAAIVGGVIWYRRRRRGVEPPGQESGRHREVTQV